jgi:hypothetical protein
MKGRALMRTRGPSVDERLLFGRARVLKMEGILLNHGRNYFSQDRPLQLFLEHLGFRHRGSSDELGSHVSTRMMPEA